MSTSACDQGHDPETPEVEESGTKMTRAYLVVYTKCVGSNFSGHAPDVLGCVSEGDTLEEMSAMMREALEFHLEGLAALGRPAPEAQTTSVEFKSEDFDDVEYFVVQSLEVKLPTQDMSEMDIAGFFSGLQQWDESGKKLNELAAQIKERIGDAPIYIDESGKFHIHPDLIEEVSRPGNEGMHEFLRHMQRISVAERKSE